MSTLADKIIDITKQYQPFGKLCKVIEVFPENNTCTVIPIDREKPSDVYYDVRYSPSAISGEWSFEPNTDSYVLVVFLNEFDGYIVSYSEVSAVKLQGVSESKKSKEDIANDKEGTDAVESHILTASNPFSSVNRGQRNNKDMNFGASTLWMRNDKDYIQNIDKDGISLLVNKQGKVRISKLNLQEGDIVKDNQLNTFKTSSKEKEYAGEAYNNILRGMSKIYNIIYNAPMLDKFPYNEVTEEGRVYAVKYILKPYLDSTKDLAYYDLIKNFITKFEEISTKENGDIATYIFFTEYIYNPFLTAIENLIDLLKTKKVPLDSRGREAFESFKFRIKETFNWGGLEVLKSLLKEVITEENSIYYIDLIRDIYVELERPLINGDAIEDYEIKDVNAIIDNYTIDSIEGSKTNKALKEEEENTKKVKEIDSVEGVNIHSILNGISDNVVDTSSTVENLDDVVDDLITTLQTDLSAVFVAAGAGTPSLNAKAANYTQQLSNIKSSISDIQSAVNELKDNIDELFAP